MMKTLKKSIKSWSELSEMQKEFIAKEFYHTNKKERREIIRHSNDCGCTYQKLSYCPACYPNFYTKFLSNFEVKIDLDNFDEAIDAANHLPFFAFNLIPFCINLDRAKQLMNISKKVYKHLPEKFRNAKEIYERAIYSYRGSMLRYMPNHLKNDTKFAAKAINQSVDAIRFFNKKVRSSKKIEKILLKTKIDNIKCRSTVYLLPEKVQKKIVWLKPNMLFFADLLNKTSIDCPETSLQSLFDDTWNYEIIDSYNDSIGEYIDREKISKIWHADKIITRKNLEKFGEKFFVIYLAKYLYEHQRRWKVVELDNFKDGYLITNQNLIIPAILESLIKKVSSKALKKKLKYRTKFFLPNNPFLQISSAQKIKDLQLDESYLVNKVASAAVKTFENIAKGQVSWKIETEGLFGCPARNIPLLPHKPNPYIAWDPLPF
tara:strand:+ start:1585 stop:2880 length:1296 start_codon:yes stop_codon:yes gene_type:complete